MKYNRLLPLLIPFIILILFEIFFLSPKMIYVSLVLANLLIFFSVSQFTRASDVSKRWWNFLILPALFSTGLAAYSILLANKFIVQFLLILNSVFLYFYLRAAYYYLYQPVTDGDLSLKNISAYGNLLIFFFIASVAYGLQSFLNIPTWLLAVAMAVIAALAIYQTAWTNGIRIKPALVYILIGSLILTELTWAISFLPLTFNAAGLILAVCYYILTGLVKHHLLSDLKKRTVKIYLSFGIGSILLILLTARWM